MHFVAIGGAGMSGVARIMLARGMPVSGSDAKRVARPARARGRGGGGARRPRRRHYVERRRHRRHLLGHPRRQRRARGAAQTRDCRCCTAPRRSPATHGRVAPGRRRGSQRQDDDDLDAHRRAAGLRHRPVLRRRGRAGQARHQRAPRDRRHLRRRGRRERRVVPGLPARGRRSSPTCSPTTSTSTATSRRSRRRTPRSSARSSRAACSSRVPTTRGREALARGRARRSGTGC